MDRLPTTDEPRNPELFCHRNNTFSRRTTSYFRTTDETHAPKGQVAVQANLCEQMRIKVPDEK